MVKFIRAGCKRTIYDRRDSRESFHSDNAAIAIAIRVDRFDFVGTRVVEVTYVRVFSRFHSSMMRLLFFCFFLLLLLLASRLSSFGFFVGIIKLEVRLCRVDRMCRKFTDILTPGLYCVTYSLYSYSVQR